MWAIYQKSDGKIVSLTADSDVEIDKEQALKETVPGLVGSKNLNDYDAFQVKDRDKVRSVARSVGRGAARVRTTAGGKQDVVDDSPDSAALVISTNAQQFHPVDNVPLIPGDGSSFLVVTLQKVNDQGQPLTRKTVDNDVIWLRIDHGSLRDDTESAQPIRSVTLASGTAKFRIYSESAKRLATVQMLSTNPELQAGGVRVEFT